MTPQNIAILGSGDWTRTVAENLYEATGSNLRLVGYISDKKYLHSSDTFPANLPFLGHVETLSEIVRQHRLHKIYVVLSHHTEQSLVVSLLTLQHLPVSFKIIPGSLLTGHETAAQGKSRIAFVGMEGRQFRRPGLYLSWGVKRVIDFVIALGLVGLLAPLILLIAILVRLDSPGPAFYRQQRVGKDGKLFWMYKFRTMQAAASQPPTGRSEERTGNNSNLIIYHKFPGDPRITRLGRLLRRSSLDELPQLFNVLNGSMSLVGPRPELLDIVRHYQSWQLVRLAVLPGMTGWWQVNGRADKPLLQNIEYDLYYIAHFSLWLDLKILLRTVVTVIMGYGAY